MTRVLMFGYGPLPVEKLPPAGPSLRTWHFLNTLLEAGHDVCLIAGRLHSVYPAELPDVVSQRKGSWTYRSVSDKLWYNRAAMQALIKEWPSECLIGITTAAAATAAGLAQGLPLWADLYGSLMAEAQMKALVYGDDAYLAHFWEMERRAIERADMISTVSERQKWSVVGELGMWGRLNQWTSGYDWVTSIPAASEITPYQSTRRQIRGVLAEENAFVILNTGGYNTWTDIDTLFKALETIMSQYPEVVFVSLGGAIAGHDDITYARFRNLIKASPYRHRYKLQGWVPNEDVPNYYLESNLAVNVDRISYEALLGSRTRVLDWMRAGLPCVLSSLTELSSEMVAAGAALAYQPENLEDLTRCLKQCITHREATAEMGQRARQLLLERFTFEAATPVLRAWVEKPWHAPDYGHPIPRLVKPYQTVWAQIRQSLHSRRLSLNLALFVWPVVGWVAQRLGLPALETTLAKLGRRALRLGQSQYQAAYHRCWLPQRMQVGQAYPGKVKLQNTSTLTWFPSEQSKKGISLAYRWKTEQGLLLDQEERRFPMPKTVAPGGTVMVPLVVTAPRQSGCYRLELDLLREAVTWFSEVGSPGPSLLIEVTE